MESTLEESFSIIYPQAGPEDPSPPSLLCNVAAGGGKVALFVGGGFNIGNGSPLIISNL